MHPTKTTTERLLRDRLALAPCLAEPTASEAAKLLAKVEQLGADEFLQFLQFQRLDPFWRVFLSPLDPSGVFANWPAILRDNAMRQAAQQLKEHHCLGLIHQTFTEWDIAYFVFKGANLRYTIYPDPLLRTASDIDVFVRDEDKLRAARALTEAGFMLELDAATISHEATLNKGGVSIDLHWQLMRPGRSRIDLTDYLFANREPFADGWQGLNHPASLLVMLVHPAVTKHVASPNAMLVHMADLARLVEQEEPVWTEVRDMLTRAGLRTAAWSSLYLLHRYSGQENHRWLAQQLEPGAARARYLRHWIDHDLVYRHFNRPMLRGLFTLALQDSLRDMAHAANALLATRRQAQQQLAEFAAGCD